MGCASSKSTLVIANNFDANGQKISNGSELLIGHTDVLSRTEETKVEIEAPGQTGVLPDIMDPRLVQKTVRIFLSSTFTDTRVDRNSLMEDVFEPIRELCQQHGIAFEVVDLRWGVRQESVDDHRVVNICMEEIKRCQETSLGVAFIAILGDKYGWRPLPQSIDADEFETLLQFIDQSDRELIVSWYVRDDNSVPACYILQPISTQFPINSTNHSEVSNAWQEWGNVEKTMWKRFRAAVDKASLGVGEKEKFTFSVTQREVERGVVTDPEASHRTLVVDRRFDDINEKDKAARNFVDLQESGEKDHECQQLLSELKEQRIPSSLDIGRVLKFTSLKWHHEGIRMDRHENYIKGKQERVVDTTEFVSSIDLDVELKQLEVSLYC